MVTKMGKRLFKVRLFGFKKQDVIKYLDEITDDFTAKLNTAQSKTELVEKELAKSKQYTDELFAEIEKLKKEKQEAVLKVSEAERDARLIIEDAKEIAAKEKTRIETEIAAKRKELYQLKRRAVSFKKQVIASAKRFSSDITEDI